MVCPKSRARFTPTGESPNQISGTKFPPGYGLPESGALFTPPGYDDLNAKIFIATPAEIQTES